MADSSVFHDALSILKLKRHGKKSERILQYCMKIRGMKLKID